MTIITMLEDQVNGSLSGIIYKGDSLSNKEFVDFCINYLNKAVDETEIFDPDDFDYDDGTCSNVPMLVLDDTKGKYSEFPGMTYFSMFEV